MSIGLNGLGVCIGEGWKNTYKKSYVNDVTPIGQEVSIMWQHCAEYVTDHKDLNTARIMQEVIILHSSNLFSTFFNSFSLVKNFTIKSKPWFSWHVIWFVLQKGKRHLAKINIYLGLRTNRCRQRLRLSSSLSFVSSSPLFLLIHRGIFFHRCFNTTGGLGHYQKLARV